MTNQLVDRSIAKMDVRPEAVLNPLHRRHRQRAMFAEYETTHQPPFETVVDLDKEIRPTLDRLTPEMMRALGQALPVLERADGRKALEALSRRRNVEAPGGQAAMHAALAPLLDIAGFPP